jgi:transposase-like protein
MPRGVPHSPELRAQVVAAVLAGTTVAQAAVQFGVNKSLVSRWAAQGLQPIATEQRARARDPETLEELLFDLVATNLQTLRLQLQAATRPDWLEKQSAAELAQLVAAERDTVLRLLAGLRPAVDHNPAGLPPPADAASGPADDGG